MTEAGWLDVHFEANRPEYEGMLRSVPMEFGWRVLDAGCGSGGFLPMLAEMVGSTGQVTAFDLAPDNVATVKERLRDWTLACPIETRVGSVVNLPFADNQFDAVWCANTTEYLGDDDLATALQEFRRVVRPGGLVAIKDADGSALRFEPTPTYLMLHVCETSQVSDGIMRAPRLPAWLAQAGYEEVRARSTLIERWAPLRPIERQFAADALNMFAKDAVHLPLPDADLILWQALADPAEVEAFVARPDFYYREVHLVSLGRVP
jgi:ubiquinone/menaquinone biosynthesis C-methylase UbiE